MAAQLAAAETPGGDEVGRRDVAEARPVSSILPQKRVLDSATPGHGE